MEEFMTVTQAAEMKQLSTGHVRQLCIDGKLSGATKMGNQRIIPKKSVMEYEAGLQGFAAFWAHKKAEEEALMMKVKDAAKNGGSLPADD